MPAELAQADGPMATALKRVAQKPDGPVPTLAAPATEIAAQRVTHQAQGRQRIFFGHARSQPRLTSTATRGWSASSRMSPIRYSWKKSASRFRSQAQQAQKMEAIGTLAGGIAHDFNNLLMGIQGNVSLIMLNKEPGHRDVAYLKNIEKAVVRGSDLTRQVLGFARGGKYEVHTTDLQPSDRAGDNPLWALTQGSHDPQKPAGATLDRRNRCRVRWNRSCSTCSSMPGKPCLEGARVVIETANVAVEENTPGRPPDAAPGRYICITVAGHRNRHGRPDAGPDL
jgi:hypothetical protein